MRNGPGIAVIDFAHPEAEYQGYVVSVLPFTPGKYYRFRAEHLETLVDLPPGTLTQRSMILAVRIHPEHPASTEGQEDPILLSEASSQSNYQAQIHLQGTPQLGIALSADHRQIVSPRYAGHTGGSGGRELAQPGPDGFVRRLRG